MKQSWKNWPVTGSVLGVAIVSGLGLLYWSNVADREHYLQSRNFRLLAVLARQTEQLIDNRSRVYKENITRLCEDESNLCAPVSSDWMPWPARDPLIKDSSPAIQELAQGQIRHQDTKLPLREDLKRLSDSKGRVAADGTALQFEWSIKEVKGAPSTVGVKVPAAETLRGIFDAKIEQGAFDTVLLTDVHGRVVYVTGRRATELQGTSIADFVPGHARESPLARTTSEQRVLIAGATYRVFMQPCCRTDSPRSDTTGLIVVGLVEQRAMQEASLAISPVLVLTGVVLIIALLVGWSFLKVALIGSQQRVTRIDVLQLGASGIFGLALATILLLTSSSYARLSADIDTELQELADMLDTRLSTEVKKAASQLNQMTDALKKDPCVNVNEPGKDGKPPKDPCAAITRRWSYRQTLPSELRRHYEDFSVFALLDTAGFQRVKAGSTPPARQRVDVSDREYFLTARAGQGLWTFKECPHGCVLESHWSWTTGKPQVVLSTPTHLNHFPVAALSIPMAPLLGPVLPAGFEFAVLDDKGRVQFHSDRQRNVHENMFLETDQDPRLRSLVETHGAATLNLPYWGRPYRAYVRPTLVPGWSVVALHSKQPGRALVLEWSTIALLLQGGYMLIWIALTLALMASNASWLWPDPLRRPWYRALSLFYTIALLAWIALATRTDLPTTVVTGLLLPPALWGVTCIVLMPRPKDTGQPLAWSDLRRDYCVAGTLMLAITAGVPAASLAMWSSDEHLEAYLKEQQIALAHRVDQPAGCADQHVQYAEIFYNAVVTCTSDVIPESSTDRPNLHWRFEDYVPYLTSASALRELMHERADDFSWTGKRSSNDLAVTVWGRESMMADGVNNRVRLDVSALGVPPVIGARARDNPRIVSTALILLLVLAVGVVYGAYWIVTYLLRRVVLADVLEPVGTNGRLVTSPGQHVLVMCEDPAALAKELEDKKDVLLPLTRIVTAPNASSEWRQARRTASALGSLQRLVIPDLDNQSEDVGLMRRKLSLVEELMGDGDLTILLLTRMSKRALASSVRSSWTWNREPERWSKILDRLTVVRHAGTNSKTPCDLERERWWYELRDLLRERAEGFRQWWKGSHRARDWRKDLLDSEAAAWQTVEPFCRELEETPAFRTGSLSKDQILEELEERAGSIYRGIWQSCDESERVVLEHVAQYGLTSTTSRRAVRRLLARRLLRKDPDLRLMNRSFRRFVLEEERRQEVVLLESRCAPSLWDRLRVPLGAAAIIAGAFLAATQREAFNATLTMAAGVTTAVPTLVKLTNLLTQFTPKGVGDQKLNG